MEQFTFSKKYFFLLFVLFLTPFLGFSQHFTQATNNGAGNWHIYTTLADLDGVALEAGDEIALFHGNVCVGTRTLTAELDGSYGLAVANDFIAYETNNGDPGYTGGNTYSWRCWDASASAEYIGTMSYNTTHSPQDYVGGTFPATMTFRWSWVDLTFTAVAPTAGDIGGTITNFDGGAPIESVSVTATGTSTYTTSTDASGIYLFDGIDLDTYTVSTSHADFQDASQAGVVVTDGGTTTEDFVLTFKTGTLNGFVYDQFSTPVVGATVTLNGGATDDTDGTGAYSITVAPGTYTATASEPGYSNTVIAGLVISPNATTTQNFTIDAAGTLSGTVTDGTNTGPEDGVLVTVVETGDFVTTAGGGLFSFDLSTGTYSLTFEKAPFSNGSLSGFSVTAGNTTTADVTIFAPVWGDFEDGDPFSDVWTVYLNTVTGDGTPIKAGDELSVWAPEERGNITAYAPFESGSIGSVSIGGYYTSTSAISAFSSPSGESGTITSVGDGSPNAQFNSSTIPTNGWSVDIFGTTNYNTTAATVSAVTGSYFETGVAYGASETGYWVRRNTPSNVTTVTAEKVASLGLVNGSSVTISGSSNYDGTYNISNVTATSFDIPVIWSGTETASWVAVNAKINTSAPHGLSTFDIVEITGAGSYNGTHTIYYASGSEFVIDYVYTVSETGSWANNAATKVTSTAHGKAHGESLTIAGSTNYNGTFTIENLAADPNSFNISTAFVGDDAAGGWVYGEQMVGTYLFDGPVSGAGTAHALKAYSVLNDASTGYESGEEFVFKLSYAGGAILTALNSIDFAATGGGLTHPGTTFPAGNTFSKVDLDFDLPPGDLDVKFTDELAAAPDADLSVELFKSGVSVTTLTFASGSAAYLNFPGLDAGEYSITVTSERFETTSYSGISIAPSTTTTKDYTINHFADETQTINLTSGYQLVSRRVGEYAFDMSDFLYATVSGTLVNFDMTKDEDGNSDTYTAGVVTDGGVQWDIKRAYNFKMNTATSVSITGTPITYDADITIRTGFNMISYLPNYNLDGEVAFAALMTDDLEFIRDRDGNSITKVGGVWVDHIGNSSAGEGFLVKWTGAPVTFNYPASGKSANATDNTAELVHFPFYNGYGNPMKDTYTMYIGGADLEVGDEVAAYDGNTLVGATVINSDNNLDNNLNAFEELFDGAGFSAGNQITMKVWKASEDKEYWLNFTNTSETDNLYKETVYPSTDGMKSTMDVTLSPLGLSDNLAEFISVYPNPSTGYVKISSPENIDRLTVINLVGQTVLDITPESNNTELNLEGYKSGLYFVNMVIEGQRVTKKLTIQ